MFNMRNKSLKMCVSSVFTVFNRNSQPFKYLFAIDHQQNRSISRTHCVTAKKTRDYYDDLKVTKTATQEEIKTAFYSLSKLHHPDTNKGSADAAQKFLHINEAYEVIGNVRSRESYDMENDMFDKLGYGPGMESEFGDSGHMDEEEDDAQTRFYRQHMRRSQVPHSHHESPEDRKFRRWMNQSLPTGLKKK